MNILTLKMASEFLTLHPEVLRKKAASGEIPAKKIGFGVRSPWRFVKTDLERYLSKSPVEQHPSLEPHLQSLIRELKTSDDLDKIANAIHILGIEGAEEAVDLIVERLNSPFDEIRLAVVRALLNILGVGSKKWVYPLLDEDVDENIKITIAHFFNKIENDRKCADILISIFKNAQDERFRRLAAYGLTDSHPDIAFPFIRKDLTSNHPALRYRAIMELGKADFKDDAIDLKRLLNDKVEKIKMKAIEMIGVKNLRSLIPELIQIIQSECSNDVKRVAGLAIARMHQR